MAALRRRFHGLGFFGVSSLVQIHGGTFLRRFLYIIGLKRVACNAPELVKLQLVKNKMKINIYCIIRNKDKITAKKIKKKKLKT